MSSTIKYQIFLSSTYENLISERQHVIKAILDLNCIPAAMEFFPGSSLTISGLINNILAESDFVILLISDKYRLSDNNQNFSYTEIEYDIAVEKNIPVVCFLKKGVEENLIRNDDLSRFWKKIKKASTPIMKWDSGIDLENHIKTSISHMKEISKSNGWVRGNNNHIDLIEELGESQKHILSLINEVARKKGEISVLKLETNELEKLSIQQDLIYEKLVNKNRKPKNKINALLRTVSKKLLLIDDKINEIDELEVNYQKLLRTMTVEEKKLEICNEISKNCFISLEECTDTLREYKKELFLITREFKPQNRKTGLQSRE